MTCLSLAVTYIYTDKVLLNVDNAINVLDLAKKYLLGPLEDRTASYITEHLMPQNVCFFLDSANLLGDVMKKYVLLFSIGLSLEHGHHVVKKRTGRGTRLEGQRAVLGPG